MSADEARHLVSAVGAWIRSRMSRQQYWLWTPLSADDVANRLRSSLRPAHWWAWSAGYFDRAELRCTVQGRSVRLTVQGRPGRNSWRWVFDGQLEDAPSGCWLNGTVGPHVFIPVFSAVWVGFVGLFCVGGWIGLMASSIAGDPRAGLPFALIPTALLIFFVILTETASRRASREWDAGEHRLRELLQCPD